LSDRRVAKATSAEAESSPSSIAKDFIEVARKQIGRPYVWDRNGQDENGDGVADAFDCSGLVHFVARESLEPSDFGLPYYGIHSVDPVCLASIRLSLAAQGDAAPRLEKYEAQSRFYRDYLRALGPSAAIDCKDARDGDIIFVSAPAWTGVNHIGFVDRAMGGHDFAFLSAPRKGTRVRHELWAEKKPGESPNRWKDPRRIKECYRAEALGRSAVPAPSPGLAACHANSR